MYNKLSTLEVRFFLHPTRGKTPAPGVIYCRVKLSNSTEYSDFCTGLHAWQFCKKTQRITDAVFAADNDQLQTIRLQLIRLHTGLLAAGKSPTAKELKRMFTEPNAYYLLLDCFNEMLQEIVLEYSAKNGGKKIPRNSLKGRQTIFNNVKQFLEHIDKTDLSVESLNEEFAMRFEAWLYASRERCCGNYTAKNLQMLKRLSRWAYRKKYCTAWHLEHLEIEFENVVEIEYLNDSELEKLEKYNFASATLQKAADAWLFMSYTGLGYSDYLTFDESKDVYTSKNRQWIYKERGKTGCIAELPYSPLAAAIYQKYKGNLPKMENGTMNRLLKEVSCLVGIRPLKTHMARKTFAMHWLNSPGVTIETVSRMLGHSSPIITQRHYSRVLRSKIEREVLELV
jgi:integrase